MDRGFHIWISIAYLYRALQFAHGGSGLIEIHAGDDLFRSGIVYPGLNRIGAVEPVPNRRSAGGERVRAIGQVNYMDKRPGLI